MSRRDFWRILYNLRSEGVTIVIATSYLDEAERCTRLGLLYGGRMIHCGTPNELEKLMPGELLAVSSAEGRRARALVTGREGVSKALLVGDGVHIVVDDADRRMPEIANALRNAGIRFEQIEKLRPSIEDLFVSLLDRPGESS